MGVVKDTVLLSLLGPTIAQAPPVEGSDTAKLSVCLRCAATHGSGAGADRYSRSPGLLTPLIAPRGHGRTFVAED